MKLQELQRAIGRANGDVFVVDADTYDQLLWRVPLAERAEWDYVPWFTPRGVVRIERQRAVSEDQVRLAA
jgi:hypothetical protein